MKLNIKSRKGFTLIELLVVIGILAVLAAIAIPSVAGLIDRANQSSDATNSNEMTNAIERFASEYELYYQDIASGAIKSGQTSGFDSAQGRVYNVTKVTDRSGIERIEKPQSTKFENTGTEIAIYRDTKYPVNAATAHAIIKNYTKTSSSTFEPKQSDMHYWYSPDCGVVVVAEPTKTAAELDKYVISGMDAKGNDISGADRDAKWIDITTFASAPNAVPPISLVHSGTIPSGASYYKTVSDETFNTGSSFPQSTYADVYYYGGVTYIFDSEWCFSHDTPACWCGCDDYYFDGWYAFVPETWNPSTQLTLLTSINNIPVNFYMAPCFCEGQAADLTTYHGPFCNHK